MNSDYPIRARLPHEVPAWVQPASFFFITVNCAKRGENQICQPSVAEGILRSARYYHEHAKWHCQCLLLMPDHLHAIIAFPLEPGVRNTVTHWKRYLARQEGVQWQRDFFDHRLRDHHELSEKTYYVRMNPVRRGLCARIEEWPWVYRPEDRLPPSW